jgi:hypothetical protein
MERFEIIEENVKTGVRSARPSFLRRKGAAHPTLQPDLNALVQPGKTEMNERYWIAFNGSSCALYKLPLREPLVTPTPEQLLP